MEVGVEAKVGVEVEDEDEGSRTGGESKEWRRRVEVEVKEVVKIGVEKRDKRWR